MWTSSARAAVEDSERIFTELIRSIEKKRSESSQPLCASSASEDSLLEASITVNQHLSFDGVRKSVSDLKGRLEEFCKQEFSKIHQHDFCRLTLDPNTVNQNLSLSEENRVVTNSRRSQCYSDHPERFDIWNQVLSKESVSGCCYWEVEWSSRGYDVYISVSYKGITRKGRGDESWLGHNSQSWSLQCSPSLSFYHNNIQTEISASSSSRIGVYVDHSAGTLSFYSVSDTMTLLHTIHTTFTQPLCAAIGVDNGSSVKFCDPK